jgi:carbon monoxide dehydrogenase subunit G
MATRRVSRGSSRYFVSYDRTATVMAPADRIWRALERLDSAAAWSPWVQRLERTGDGLQVGAGVEAWLSTPLPIRVHIRLVVTDSVSPVLVVTSVDGDLRGVARLDLEADGPVTRAHLSWKFEMIHGVMRAMALLSGPLLRWGHDLVADATVRAFAGWLATAGTAPGVRAARDGRG